MLNLLQRRPRVYFWRGEGRGWTCCKDTPDATEGMHGNGIQRVVQPAPDYQLAEADEAKASHEPDDDGSPGVDDRAASCDGCQPAQSSIPHLAHVIHKMRCRAPSRTSVQPVFLPSPML